MDANKTPNKTPRLTEVKPGFVCLLGDKAVEVASEWRYNRGAYRVDLTVVSTGERRNHVLLTELAYAR